MSDEDGYAGEATLIVEEDELAGEVVLRGHFQPIDGRSSWYGRLAEHTELADLVGGRKRAAVVRTPQGEATGEVSDPDPWRRYRITGVSTPPFAVPTGLADL